MSQTRTRQGQLGLFRAGRRGAAAKSAGRTLRGVGLFSGIGGIELGLARAGHETLLLCENESGAIAVLEESFPGIPLHQDVRDLDVLPAGTELVAAGFPCQDLSQAGATRGIGGENSGLVDQIFRLLQKQPVPWLLLENVPFMLQLHRGKALAHILSALEELGYRWAYRVVDSRSMGIPQRRERVYFVASLDGDPRDVLLADDVPAPPPPPVETWRSMACGFYWTEGLRGLGWAYDAVPTLKAGSTIGIPSPPAIVLRSGQIVTPDVRDAERLQGFDVGWTKPAEKVMRKGHRWKLVGNAVTVDVAEWLGQRLREPGRYDPSTDELLLRDRSWPRAAWGRDAKRYRSHVGTWPVERPAFSLEEFLSFAPTPLSEKATAGFYARAKQAKLRFPPGFLDVVEEHLDTVASAPTPTTV
jgi:DNA (cytosine-5)-methyltransferase 1